MLDWMYLGFLPEVLDRLERSLASDALSLWAGFASSARSAWASGQRRS